MYVCKKREGGKHVNDTPFLAVLYPDSDNSQIGRKSLSVRLNVRFRGAGATDREIVGNVAKVISKGCVVCVCYMCSPLSVLKPRR